VSTNVQVVTLAGQQFVIISAAEYRELVGQPREPQLPKPDASGNYPALESMRILLAQDIIRARRRLGLTQAELGRRAGVRPETLNRLEQGKHTASTATMNKLDRALREADPAEAKGPRPIPPRSARKPIRPRSARKPARGG